MTPARLIPIALAAALGVVALEGWADPPASGAALAALPANASPYDAAVHLYASAIASAEDRVRARPREWLVREQQARAMFARGRLTGSYDDYAAAQQMLDAAFRHAPDGAGPHLAQATLHLLMHRLADAERMLDAIDRYAVPPDRGEQAEMAGMRGDVFFYRGQYEAAARHYDEAEALAPGSAAFRRAIFHSKTGRPDLAEQEFGRYERSLSNPGRQLRANLELQRGILDLDGGRWPEALAHFRRADAIFPGWWLVEEHIAETMALLGDKEGAERLYRSIVERTGSPEFMDALALLLIARGETDEATTLRRRSRAIWGARLRQFPEASFGHALDHCVAFRDQACALQLAARNYAARPYGEAAEQYASVLVDAGRTAEAREMIDRVLASPWRTARTFAVATRIYTGAGDQTAAARFRAAALELNPHIFG